MIRLASLLFGGILLLLANSEGAPEVPKAEHHREYKLKDWMYVDDYSTTESATTSTDDTEPSSSSSAAAARALDATTTTTDAPNKTCSYGVDMIDNNKGKIKVGSRKGSYFDNEYCSWNITVTAGMAIKFKWKWFGLEGDSPSCPYDYVEVIDLATGISVTGLLCGDQRPPVVYTSSNRALLVFSTDYSITDIGFKIKYKASLGGGKFGVGSRHGNYSNNMNEEWIFHLPAGANGIRIKWQLFKIEFHSSCSSDYVQFVDLATSAILGTYCGNTDPGTRRYYTSIKAKFVSDGTTTEKGFLAAYKFF